MAICKMIPKSGNGATWYCRTSETLKAYATVYSLDGFSTVIRTDDYEAVDATGHKAATAVLKKAN